MRRVPLRGLVRGQPHRPLAFGRHVLVAVGTDTLTADARVLAVLARGRVRCLILVYRNVLVYRHGITIQVYRLIQVYRFGTRRRHGRPKLARLNRSEDKSTKPL